MIRIVTFGVCHSPMRNTCHTYVWDPWEILQIKLYQTMHVVNAFVACEMRENQIRSIPTAIFIGGPTQGPCANFYLFQMCCQACIFSIRKVFYMSEFVFCTLHMFCAGLQTYLHNIAKKRQTIETSQFQQDTSNTVVIWNQSIPCITLLQKLISDVNFTLHSIDRKMYVYQSNNLMTLVQSTSAHTYWLTYGTKRCCRHNGRHIHIRTHNFGSNESL